MSDCRGPHWFSLYGAPGWRSPICVRGDCRAPNPLWTPEDDQLWMESLAAGYIPEYLAEKARPPLHYAWCETCLGAVTKAEYVGPEEDVIGDVRVMVKTVVIRIEPCLHGPTADGVTFSVGAIDLLDGSPAPFPSISIRGFDPGRFQGA